MSGSPAASAGCVGSTGAATPLPVVPVGVDLGELVACAAMGTASLASRRGLDSDSDPVPAFPLAIGGVMPVGPQEEMVGPYAWRVVAVVADEHSVGDGPEGQRPRDAVCFGARGLSDSDTPVATARSRTGPFPATVRLRDSHPEPLRERDAAQVPGDHRVAVVAESPVVKRTQATRVVRPIAPLDGAGPHVPSVRANHAGGEHAA